MFTETVLAKHTSSISEFKKNPSAAMSESNGEPVAVLSHNKPAFYCVPPALFALMIDHIGDQMLLEKAEGRLDDEEVEVSLDQL
ncbi:TPA: type II toxin-antitoxin system Phd/YefM family antitoxin [Klebsiella pneumoniae]|uniref:type II toxin-antitoxin system Phd/YefM family antitoxin n=1 Tax=Klebsiella quasipneumoniae TaxID=1463165 RepID=UPI0030076071|nr:type II toxin-antitoxin system Phd/YefM family antitoxin [Klebsiella quasipneumoniae subsp. similipneumoniae]